MIDDIQGMLDALAGRYILRSSHGLLKIQRKKARCADARTAAEQSHVGDVEVACAYRTVSLGHPDRLGEEGEGRGQREVGYVGIEARLRASGRGPCSGAYSACRKVPRSVGAIGFVRNCTALSTGRELNVSEVREFSLVSTSVDIRGSIMDRQLPS